MSILRLVRNFALLVVLALAAHAAVGADKHQNGHCGQPCRRLHCTGGCVCVGGGEFQLCVPKQP